MAQRAGCVPSNCSGVAARKARTSHARAPRRARARGPRSNRARAHPQRIRYAPRLVVFDLGPQVRELVDSKTSLGSAFLICFELARGSVCEEPSRAHVAGSVGM